RTTCGLLLEAKLLRIQRQPASAWQKLQRILTMLEVTQRVPAQDRELIECVTRLSCVRVAVDSGNLDAAQPHLDRLTALARGIGSIVELEMWSDRAKYFSALESRSVDRRSSAALDEAMANVKRLCHPSVPRLAALVVLRTEMEYYRVRGQVDV